MIKQINLMNEYVSDLAVLNVKFHNLHWNVVGRQFVSVHVYLEKMYDDFFEKYDEVAERIKMLGFFAKASLKEYLDNTRIKELSEDGNTESIHRTQRQTLSKYPNGCKGFECTNYCDQ